MTKARREWVAYLTAGTCAGAAVALLLSHGPDRGHLALLVLGAGAGGVLVWAAAQRRRQRLALTEALLENVGDYIAITDAEGRVLYQSPSVVRQLGHSADGRVGLSVLDLVHPEDAAEAQRALAIVLRKPGGAWSFRHRVQRKGGAWRVLDTQAKNLLAEPAVRGIVISSRDVTDRVRAEVRQATQLAVTRVLNEATSVAEAGPPILEAICRCAGWDLGEMWCADGEVLRWKGWWRLPGVNGAAFEAVSREATFARGAGLPGRVWESGQPAWVADVAEDPEFVRRTAAQSEGLHSAIAFPILRGGSACGVLVFFSHELRELDLVLLDLMGDVGLKISQFVESRQAEAALRDSEERFHRLSEATSEGVIVYDQGIVQDLNASISRMSGYAREELLGRSGLTLVSPESRPLLAGRLAVGTEGPAEIVALRKDGSEFPAEIDSRAITYHGRLARVIALRDISDRKKAEAALGKLSSAVEQTADSVVITDLAGIVEYANPAFEEMTGYARTEAVGRTMALLKSGRHDEAFYRRLWTSILSGRVFRGEFINKKKSGEIFYESKTITPLLDAAGQIAHFVATGSDITERKRAEAREDAHFAVTRILAEAPDLQQAVPAILEAICRGMEWDFGELWLVDAEACQLAWYDSWHLPGRDVAEFESASRDLRFARGVGVPGEVWAQGAPVWRPDAAEDPGFLRKAFARQQALHGAVGIPIRGSADVNGVIVFMSGRARESEDAVLRTMEDIGRQIGQFIERRHAESEEARLQRTVRRAAQEWRLTFDAIEAPILMVDFAGRVLRLNRAAQESAGKSFEEILGRPVEAVRLSQPWCTAAALAREAAELRAAQVVHVKDEATGKTWNLAANPVASKEADQRVIIVASDVTRIVELQESLRRSENMSAMGSLVAGVAHEVRNPLFSISANLDAFEAQFGDREEYRETLQVLRSEVDRLGGLMQALLDYGKPPALEMAERSLEDVIAQAVHACRPQATRVRVSLASQVKRGLPSIRMDRKRLVQVFQNLIENAVQHTPPRGTVSISTRLVADADQEVVEAEIEDSGPGIAEEDLPRIFEPFFTRRRGGTGLGLSIAARIVEEHGGRIAARNRAEGGAAMLVRLPSVRPAGSKRGGPSGA